MKKEKKKQEDLNPFESILITIVSIFLILSLFFFAFPFLNRIMDVILANRVLTYLVLIPVIVVLICWFIITKKENKE
jgi:hypothetical protein